MSINRKYGFYWVRSKYSYCWYVARWDPIAEKWALPGQDDHFHDSDFVTIIEDRIEGPD